MERDQCCFAPLRETYQLPEIRLRAILAVDTHIHNDDRSTAMVAFVCNRKRLNDQKPFTCVSRLACEFRFIPKDFLDLLHRLQYGIAKRLIRACASIQ
jgi:hypothetical protein